MQHAAKKCHKAQCAAKCVSQKWLSFKTSIFVVQKMGKNFTRSLLEPSYVAQIRHTTFRNVTNFFVHTKHLKHHTLIGATNNSCQFYSPIGSKLTLVLKCPLNNHLHSEQAYMLQCVEYSHKKIIAHFARVYNSCAHICAWIFMKFEI